MSFALDPGERFGLVGESGCGKTTTILALMGLLPPNASLAGEVRVNGRNILAGGEDSVRAHRWTDIAMVFQGAMNALNPVKKIGWQIAEPMAFHDIAHGAAARRRAGELLELVGIPAAAAERYPHEFSGGMRQRASIAMALACDPKILLADEPTTALDVMVQAQILDLLTRLSGELGLALVLVTHDLPVVAQVCDRAAVMYAGEIVESGPDGDALPRAPPPVHPAALRRHSRPVRRGRGGLHPGAAAAAGPRTCPAARSGRAATPRSSPAPTSARCSARSVPATRPPAISPASPPGRRRERGTAAGSGRPGHAVPGPARPDRAAGPRAAGCGCTRWTGSASRLARGEMLALVGESGCGKTSTAQTILRMVNSTSGTIRLNGTDITGLSQQQMRPLRRKLQMIYQDPYESLDPAVPGPGRRRGADAGARDRQLPGRARGDLAVSALERAGLAPAEQFLERYPHELSGGQRQRVSDRRGPGARPGPAARGRARVDAGRVGPGGRAVPARRAAPRR